jgi:hypothetical protein
MLDLTKRTRRTLWTVFAVLALLALAVFLRSKAPPETARLLPEADGILYLDLKPFHPFFHAEIKPPVRAPEYQRFVDAIGFDWERDLDRIAIAVHRMRDPHGPNGPAAYSMVLQGKLTGQKLNTWLNSQSTARENYAGQTVYSIPSEGRTVRIAQIGYDMVAVSNTPTPEQIHLIIDRHRTAALPLAGSTLLARHYHEIPLLSFAWGVGQIGLPFSESGAISVLGFSLKLPDDTAIVASLAPALPLVGSLHLRVEEIAPSEAIAQAQAAQLTTLLGLLRGYTAPLAPSAANNSLREALNTAEIESERNRVVLKATLSAATLSGGSSAPEATTNSHP